MKRIFFIGLFAGVTMLITSLAWSSLATMLRPELAGQYQNPQIFRPWSDPAMSLFFLHPIVVGVILAWLWSKTNHLIKTGAAWKRGITFGYLYWLATISGMMISYSTFQISLIMVLSWTLNGLVQALVGGLIISYYDLLRKSKAVN